jgi:hypothetical protein
MQVQIQRNILPHFKEFFLCITVVFKGVEGYTVSINITKG